MTLSMPSAPNFKGSRFALETNTQTYTSPLTKATQRLSLAGSRWVAMYTLPKMTRNQAAAWQAFLIACEGQANKFYAFDPDAKIARGTASGTPLVKGASQTGSSLNTDGWTAGTTCLKAGDYFSFNGELKMATSDVLVDGSGNATIPFKPAIRTAPADNAPLTILNANCTMVLTDDSQASWATDQNGIYNEITFTAYEVFA